MRSYPLVFYYLKKAGRDRECFVAGALSHRQISKCDFYINCNPISGAIPPANPAASSWLVYSAVLKSPSYSPASRRRWWFAGPSNLGQRACRLSRGIKHRQPFHSGSKRSAGTRHPGGFSAARGRLWLPRRGRRQRRRRHPGAGAGEAGIIAATISFPTLLPQRKPPQIRRSPAVRGFAKALGLSRPKSEPKPRKAAELVRPRAERT